LLQPFDMKLDGFVNLARRFFNGIAVAPQPGTSGE
jgi:hypothetical protein